MSLGLKYQSFLKISNMALIICLISRSDDDDEAMEKKSSDGEEDTNILDAEPILNRGVMSAILLATNKGYLAESKQPTTSRAKEPKSKADSIEAANYTIEERNYYDIDDKYNRNRNDRYSSGPLMDFDEKRGYKPDVKLNYFDEKGRSMNEKEAFRYFWKNLYEKHINACKRFVDLI